MRRASTLRNATAAASSSSALPSSTTKDGTTTTTTNSGPSSRPDSSSSGVARSSSFRDKLGNAQQLATKNANTASAAASGGGGGTKPRATAAAAATAHSSTKPSTENRPRLVPAANKNKDPPSSQSQSQNNTSPIGKKPAVAASKENDKLQFNIATGRVERHLLFGGQSHDDCSALEHRQWKQSVDVAAEIATSLLASSSSASPPQKKNTVSDSLSLLSTFFSQYQEDEEQKKQQSQLSSKQPSRSTSPALLAKAAASFSSIKFPVASAAAVSPTENVSNTKKPVTVTTKKSDSSSNRDGGPAAGVWELKPARGGDNDDCDIDESSSSSVLLVGNGAKLQPQPQQQNTRRVAAAGGGGRVAAAAAAASSASRQPPPKSCSLTTTCVLDDDDDMSSSIKVASITVENNKIDVPTITNEKKKKTNNNEDEEEEEENPWRKRATSAASGGGVDVFQLQSNGWTSAPACGRTAPLSVTCLVKKKSGAASASASGTGSELRHVGGAISSINNNAGSGAEHETLRLTSNAAPINVLWPVSDNNSKQQQNPLLAKYPSLVPSGLSCTLSVGGNSSQTRASATYDGPLLNGVRHSSSNRIGELTLTHPQQQQQRKTSSSSSLRAGGGDTTSGSDADMEQSGGGGGQGQPPTELRAFSQVRYVGRWIKDKFTGAGAVTVDWDADATGAGSGCVTLASPDWAGLNRVEETTDVLVRFGGGARPDDLEARSYFQQQQQQQQGDDAIAATGAITFGGAQSSGLQPPSQRSPYLSMLCTGKILNSNGKDSSSSAPHDCYHTFKCATVPQLRSLPKDGVELGGNSSKIFSSNPASSGFSRHHQHQQQQDDTDGAPGATLGSFLLSRASTPTAGGGNNNSGENVASVPKLLLSLACADALQMLFANVELLGLGGGGGCDNNSPAVLAQIYEGLLASQSGRWSLLGEMTRIVRDSFVEPKKYALAQAAAELETATRRRDAAKKEHAAAKESSCGAEAEIAAMQKLVKKTSRRNSAAVAEEENQSASSPSCDDQQQQQQQQHDDDLDDDDDDAQAVEDQEHQHRVEQLGVDTASAHVDLQEQQHNKHSLEEELSNAQRRLKALDEDIDALQREDDHCADTKRSLAARRAEAQEERRKHDAQYDAAKAKLDGLSQEKGSLELSFFRSVLEPEERAKIASECFSSQNNSSSNFVFFAELTRSIDTAAAQLDKQRAAAVEAAQGARAATEAMHDAKDRVRQQIKETPDESSLLVAFQSAEGQSEIVLSRIRALQADSGGGGEVVDEASVRAKHAATMSNFSKRLADIRDSIRSMTDKEAALVAEMDELQKKQQQGASCSSTPNGGGSRSSFRISSTAPVQNEFFGGEGAEDDEPKRRQLAGLRSELKQAKAEMRELKLSMRGPGLLVLDSSQLPACSNELLRSLLTEAKTGKQQQQQADSSPFSTPVKSGSFSAASPAPGSGLSAATSSSTSSSAAAAPALDLRASLKDRDSKMRALQQAISQCDFHISDLKSRAQRVRLLESKLEVAMDNASHKRNVATMPSSSASSVSATVGAARSMVSNSSNSNNFASSGSGMFAGGARRGSASLSGQPKLPSLRK